VQKMLPDLSKDKTSNLNFTLEFCMGTSTKSLFYSGLFNKCHHRTNLIAFLLFSKIVSKRRKRTQKSEILNPLHTNSDSEW
jgi:hypothetical protein